LGIRPSIRLGQILQSSDEVRSGNGVLAFGTEKFRNLVLLQSKVEIGGTISSTLCGGDSCLRISVAGAVVMSIQIEVTIIMVVVAASILRSQVDIFTSSSGHFVSCNKALISLIKVR
jgi:hypothetical protein